MNEFYCYIYYDPQNNEPFLVGKGSGKRAYDHLTESFNESKNKHKWAKIEQLKKINIQPKIFLIYTDTEDQAYWLEGFLTHHWGIESEGGILTNIIHGGTGGWKDVPKSEEHKRKIGEANKLVHKNEETKNKHRQLMLGNQYGKANKGIPKSEKYKLKMSKLKKKLFAEGKITNGWIGRHHTEESKEKNRIWHTGKKASEETKKKIGKGHTGLKYNIDPNHIHKLSEKWLVTFPDGHKEEIFNLNLFCKQYKLSSGNFATYGYTKGFKAIKLGL